MRIKFPGRYGGEALSNLLTGLHRIGVKSNQKTGAERKVAFVTYSLGHDLKDGFRSRDHGFDVKSIAEVALRNLQSRVGIERRAQELQYLQEFSEILEEAQDAVMARIQELASATSSIAESRQRDIDRIRARISNG